MYQCTFWVAPLTARQATPSTTPQVGQSAYADPTTSTVQPQVETFDPGCQDKISTFYD